MKELLITVTDRVAKYVGNEHPVCNNKYKAVFAFDDEWQGTDKRVRFIWNGQYKDVDLVDDACEVPVVSGTVLVKVGVVVGERLVTTPAQIPYRLSIICEGNPEEAEFVRWSFDETPTEGSINPVTSGGIYEALQGIQVESDTTATPDTIMARDENGYTDVLTPEIEWGRDLYDEEKHKAVNVEALDTVARIVTQGCDATSHALVEDVENRLISTIDDAENRILSYMDTGDDIVLAQARRYTDEVYENLWQISIAETDVQDTYSTRETAGGLEIIDGAKCEVKKVEGDTQVVDGEIVHVTFEGIKSVNASSTDSDWFMLDAPVELGEWDYIDGERQQVVRQTHSFTVADTGYGSFSNVTPFGSQGNYYISFAFSGLPTVIKEEMSKMDVVSNYYPTASVSTNENKKCIMYSTVSSGKSAPRFDFRDDELIVRNDDGTVNKDATIAAFKARFAEVGLQISYKIGEAQTETIYCPTTYNAWRGGTETVLSTGLTPTITQSYIQRVRG